MPEENNSNFNWTTILFIITLVIVGLYVVCSCFKCKSRIQRLSPAWLARKVGGMNMSSVHQKEDVATDNSVYVSTVSFVKSTQAPLENELQMQAATKNDSIIKKLYPSVDITSNSKEL